MKTSSAELLGESSEIAVTASFSAMAGWEGGIPLTSHKPIPQLPRPAMQDQYEHKRRNKRGKHHEAKSRSFLRSFCWWPLERRASTFRQQT